MLVSVKLSRRQNFLIEENLHPKILGGLEKNSMGFEDLDDFVGFQISPGTHIYVWQQHQDQNAFCIFSALKCYFHFFEFYLLLSELFFFNIEKRNKGIFASRLFFLFLMQSLTCFLVLPSARIFLWFHPPPCFFVWLGTALSFASMKHSLICWYEKLHLTMLYFSASLIPVPLLHTLYKLCVDRYVKRQ